ncbi:unnamed protein product [Linum tenue]|uniref:Adenylate-forming reductase n=1 Tax=Linum tenue TaxID=586396 RepID=A0AAV0MGV1_9ROSI|nr:unnamed protein product [Linum tenue]
MMKGQPIRFSSCRGVAFEIKPHDDPFAIPKPTIHQQANDDGPIPPDGRRFSVSSWIHQGTGGRSSKVGPGDIIQRSLSVASSSHFCDLDVDDDPNDYIEADEVVVDVTLSNMEQGKTDDDDLPRALGKTKKQTSSRLSVILLDQGLFTVYKRLFLACFTLNVVGLVLAATGRFTYGRDKAAMFSIANIFVLTLCRSEAFLRVVFWAAVRLLGRSWVPIWIKTAATSLLQSLGGIHSGCGVSSVAWLIYSLVLNLNDRANTSPEIVVVASSILSLISLSCLAAFPLVRHLHHNLFERIHRFAGWAALGLLWAFVVLTTSYDSETATYSNDVAIKLANSVEFWFTFAITVLIIIPWLTVRRVAVTTSSPSGHASIVKFAGGVKPGILGRISPSPLSEWHSFGIISDGKIDHMMLCGAVGDFTKSLVSNPPSHLWVRGVHFAGLPYLVNLYDRVLLVATGSGICVFLSFLLQPCRADVCVVWVAKGIEQNFGQEIMEMMSRHPKDKVIVHDTALMGRPSVSQMSVEMAKKWRAEVVIVTSNPEGSRDVVDACKGAGIPAFGPIWDS